MTKSSTSPAPRRGARLRRPAGLIEQTRWLFMLCAILSLAVSVPASLRRPVAVDLLLVGASAIVLTATWIGQYLLRRVPLVLDLLVAAAVCAFALSNVGAIGVVFASLWFRAVYGSTRRVVLYAFLAAAALAASVLLWGSVPGHVGSGDSSVTLGPLPLLFVTMVVARYLALSMFAREQSQDRDAAVARLGTALLTLTDPGAIADRGRVALAEVAAATPGLRVLSVLGRDGVLVVTGHCGDFRSVPTTLPVSTLPGPPVSDEMKPLAADTLLGAAAGIRGEWLGVKVPERVDGWVIVGAPGRVPAEAVVAITSLLSQAVLALRNSDARNDLTVQARTDGLTGLANRATFAAALDEALRDFGAGVAVLFVDLDDFKTVNDGFGHAAGDELLRHVATRLSRAVRPGDVCARLGGDEFAVLLQGAGDGVGEAVAQRLVEVIAAPITLSGSVAQIGASVGLAHAGRESTGEQLLHRADIAMYSAKARGKNRLEVFDLNLLGADPQEVFENELAGAAAAGQLVVRYQPILSLRDGRCVAVEALVRWQHPVRGLLPPAEFIEVAERTGAIIGIGAFVLRQACRDAARWPLVEGARIAIHVNVSAAQLADPAYPGCVERAMAESAMAPKQLVLEVTESMVLNSPTVRITLDSLVALGATIAIDDFGTGFSALTTLRTLPIEIVKIDRSFLEACPASSADRAVVEAIVHMAGRLGLRTVAEGVERPEQEAYLRAIGADAIQGFLHMRPVPDADLVHWLASRPASAHPAAHRTVVPMTPRRAG